MTVDLNGEVAVRARAEGGGRVTELVLGRSGYTGEPVRLNTNRHFLARAVRLGFAEVAGRRARGPGGLPRRSQGVPLAAAATASRRSGRRTTRSASSPAAPGRPSGRSSTRRRRSPWANPSPTSRPVEPHAAAPHGTANGVATGSGTGGLAALIQEAEALHEALADAKARTHRLIGALRRHRKQARLTSATLAALRQLKLQEVAE